MLYKNENIKIASLQLSQICKIIFDDISLRWVPFGHMWLGLRLVRFSDYRFSNSIPHCCEDIPAYYRALSNTLTIIFRDFPSLPVAKGARCKHFYKQLLDKCEEAPRVLKTFPQIDFVSVFSTLCNRFLDPLTLNVSFKLAHDILPVAYPMYLFHMPVNQFCSFCKKEMETVLHLFYYCSFVQMCKRFLIRWFRDLGNIGLTPECIRFSVFRSSLSSHARKSALIVMLTEYRLSIWNCRNKARFDKKHMRPVDIAAYFLSRIRKRLWVDFYRLSRDSFVSFWECESLCTVKPDGLLINISVLD